MDLSNLNLHPISMSHICRRSHLNFYQCPLQLLYLRDHLKISGVQTNSDQTQTLELCIKWPAKIFFSPISDGLTISNLPLAFYQRQPGLRLQNRLLEFLSFPSGFFFFVILIVVTMGRMKKPWKVCSEMSMHGAEFRTNIKLYKLSVRRQY